MRRLINIPTCISLGEEEEPGQPDERNGGTNRRADRRASERTSERRRRRAPCIRHKGLSLARRPSCSPSFLYPARNSFYHRALDPPRFQCPDATCSQPTRVRPARADSRISAANETREPVAAPLIPRRADFSPRPLSTVSEAVRTCALSLPPTPLGGIGDSAGNRRGTCARGTVNDDRADVD